MGNYFVAARYDPNDPMEQAYVINPTQHDQVVNKKVSWRRDTRKSSVRGSNYL